nr:MAG TPA: hypothetical protein [Caudoviricetes sp.]
MKFDKNRVYTVLTANDVKIGSKGFFADTLSDLRDDVDGIFGDASYGEVDDILDETNSRRFCMEENGFCYNLFYLIEESM